MLEGGYLVEWVGRQAVVRLPENIDVRNAGPVGEDLLALINRGAVALILDMTATGSCGQAGAEAIRDHVFVTGRWEVPPWSQRPDGVQ